MLCINYGVRDVLDVFFGDVVSIPVHAHKVVPIKIAFFFRFVANACVMRLHRVKISAL